MSHKGQCRFFETTAPSRLKEKRRLGAFVLQLLHDYTRQYACLSYTFIDDEALLDLNRRFLQHDYYTDILTFDLSEKGSGLITGDIYISLERVKDNARQLQVRYQDELLRVILHGALHLAGFEGG